MSAFPRGGAVTPPTPEAKSEGATTNNSTDFLFGSSDNGDKKRSKKRSRDVVVDRDSKVEKHFGGGGVQHFGETQK